MSFAHHAAPPTGEWINDPNGLIHRDGAWHLFVQHSAAAPAYRSVGWALLTSPDLLRWEWQGQVIPPDVSGQAFSGSIVAEGGRLAAYLTRHDGEVQRQVRLESKDARRWAQGPPLGPEGRNVRDPFVFFCRATSDWRMLVAEPCDWTDWASDQPSRLAVWRREGGRWQFVAYIGPWMAQGLMWEVPQLIDVGERQVLLLSLVDRRGGDTRCAVRYWTGRFDGAAFHRDEEQDRLLDLGPDFYAACVEAGGPAEALLVAWASNWATARTMPWPGGIHGGPITLPRRLGLSADGRLTQRPAAPLAPARELSFDGASPLDLTIIGEGCRMSLTIDPAGVTLTRGGSPKLDWHHREEIALTSPQTLTLFEDQGLIELFLQPAGLTATLFLPGARL